MASFADNILDIRGRAIYGRDVRRAIADALTQTPEVIDDTLQQKEDEIIGYIDDFRSEMTGRFSSQDSKIDQIRSEVGDQNIYIVCSDMGGDDVLMSIANAQ